MGCPSLPTIVTELSSLELKKVLFKYLFTCVHSSVHVAIREQFAEIVPLWFHSVSPRKPIQVIKLDGQTHRAKQEAIFCAMANRMGNRHTEQGSALLYQLLHHGDRSGSVLIFLSSGPSDHLPSSERRGSCSYQPTPGQKPEAETGAATAPELCRNRNCGPS